VESAASGAKSPIDSKRLTALAQVLQNPTA